MLSRLQSAKSHYLNEKWNSEYERQREYSQRIIANSNRYTKNPYFLHSVCTPNDFSQGSQAASKQSANSRVQSAKPNQAHRRLRKSKSNRASTRGNLSHNNLPPIQ